MEEAPPHEGSAAAIALAAEALDAALIDATALEEGHPSRSGSGSEFGDEGDVGDDETVSLPAPREGDEDGPLPDDDNASSQPEGPHLPDPEAEAAKVAAQAAHAAVAVQPLPETRRFSTGDDAQAAFDAEVAAALARRAPRLSSPTSPAANAVASGLQGMLADLEQLAGEEVSRTRSRSNSISGSASPRMSDPHAGGSGGGPSVAEELLLQAQQLAQRARMDPFFGLTNEDSDGDSDEDAAEAAAEEAARVRRELIAAVRAATAELATSAALDESLHARLATWFALRAASPSGGGGLGGGAVAPTPTAAVIADRELHLRESLEAFTSERARMAREQALFDEQASILQKSLEAKEGALTEVATALKEYKHEVARSARHSHTGKHLPKELLAHYEAEEVAKDAALVQARLRHIAVGNALRKVQSRVAAREQLANGLALLDFEQLRVDNNSLRERIEDRTEELLKLRAKASQIVQTLTHVREKLHFVTGDAKRAAEQLAALEATVSAARTQLTQRKVAKESARASAARSVEAQGFVFHDSLAIDFAVAQREVLRKKAELESLQARIAAAQRVLDTDARGGTPAGGGAAAAASVRALAASGATATA